MSGFVFNNVLFTKTEESIIIRRIDRRELPHLAVFFKTASGDVDGHLKDELAAPGTDPYTPLFRIPAAKLSEFETNIAAKFEQEFRKVFWSLRKATPAWLRRSNYVIAVIDDDAIRSRIPDFAPKLRGKHRFDPEKMKRIFSEDPSHITLFDPSALHADELKKHSKPIFAVRSQRHNRMLSLVYAPSRYGTRVWLISNPIDTMSQILTNVLPTETKQKAMDVWLKVHEALQLGELGIAR